MRSTLGQLSFMVAAAGIVAAALVEPASAGNSYQDRIYADSFGNLVIHSRSGYKRIIVGAGHLAKELAGYEQTGEEDVVYLDEEPTRVVKKRCYRPPVLLKGRSYMYGLEDGELPMPAGRCP